MARPSEALRYCHPYQPSPRSKCLSKNRVSFVGWGSHALWLRTLCSQVVPVRGGPMIKKEGSAGLLPLPFAPCCLPKPFPCIYAVFLRRLLQARTVRNWFRAAESQSLTHFDE